MEDTLFRTLLFDYFGDLLTEKQRDCYDLHYNQDLSLQEIAEQYGTTRQAVWDLVRRSEQSLRELEAKTGLVARAVKRREHLDALTALARELPETDTARRLRAGLEALYD